MICSPHYANQLPPPRLFENHFDRGRQLVEPLVTVLPTAYQVQYGRALLDNYHSQFQQVLSSTYQAGCVEILVELWPREPLLFSEFTLLCNQRHLFSQPIQGRRSGSLIAELGLYTTRLTSGSEPCPTSTTKERGYFDRPTCSL